MSSFNPYVCAEFACSLRSPVVFPHYLSLLLQTFFVAEIQTWLPSSLKKRHLILRCARIIFIDWSKSKLLVFLKNKDLSRPFSTAVKVTADGRSCKERIRSNQSSAASGSAWGHLELVFGPHPPEKRTRNRKILVFPKGRGKNIEMTMFTISSSLDPTKIGDCLSKNEMLISLAQKKKEVGSFKQQKIKIWINHEELINSNRSILSATSVRICTASSPSAVVVDHAGEGHYIPRATTSTINNVKPGLIDNGGFMMGIIITSDNGLNSTFS